MGRVITTLNNGPEHVAYKAEWTTGQYASLYDPHWTIGDLLGLEPDRYHDVGRYAVYDVLVSFKGKTRGYRALALFHKTQGPGEHFRPSFWDSVAGSGGTLTDVWKEKRPPVGQADSPSKKDRFFKWNVATFLSAIWLFSRPGVRPDYVCEAGST